MESGAEQPQSPGEQIVAIQDRRVDALHLAIKTRGDLLNGLPQEQRPQAVPIIRTSNQIGRLDTLLKVVTAMTDVGISEDKILEAIQREEEITQEDHDSDARRQSP